MDCHGKTISLSNQSHKQDHFDEEQLGLLDASELVT